ncbi:MAG: peptide ABC transporter substrate-binding protein [Bacteriovoracaceae bacterium]|nr:peptide ABC transporter substrate-binding protein [Bacteriovoracaceae bacterium]
MNSSLFLLLSFLFSFTSFSLSAKINELNVQVGEEIRHLDPQQSTGISSAHIHINLFVGLYSYDHKSAGPVAEMAESYTQNKSASVWTFKLKKNYFWVQNVNGVVVKKRPVTAHDYVYSYQRILSPKLASEYGYMLYIIKNAELYNQGQIKDASQVGIKALDDYTLQFTLVGSVPSLLSYLPHHSFCAVPKEPIEKHGENWVAKENIWTSGSFAFKDWELKNKITIIKNPFFPNTKENQIDLVNFKFIGTYSAEAVRSFRAGEIDIDFMAPPSSEISPLKKAGTLKIARQIAMYFVRLNTTRKPFNDVRVRKALALVAPREEIVNYVMKAGQEPSYSLVPNTFKTYKPETFVDAKMPFPKRLELAKKLLAEAGYPEGKGFPKVNYVYNTAETHQKVAVVLSKAWKEHLGISVEPLNQEWKVYLASQSSMDFDTLRAGWVADYEDPMNFLDMFLSQSGNNRTGFKNKEYDKLIAQAQIEKNLEKRNKIMQQAEKIIMNEVPIIPLFTYTTLNLVQNYISGFYANKLDQHQLRFVKIDMNKKENFLKSIKK